MSKIVVGQRFLSKTEIELGVGRVVAVETKMLTLEFPSVKERRSYRSEGDLVRYKLQVGDFAKSEKANVSFPIVEVGEEDGLIVYYGRSGKKIKEADLVSKAGVRASDLFERLLHNEKSTEEDFEMRREALRLSFMWRSSPVRGMIGPKIDMIPHQYYLGFRACGNSELPRLMLADEVGLGKTIEAGLIWHTLHARGRVSRTLIVVPDSLKHQWMSEMRRRFNQIFTLVDKDFLMSMSELYDPDDAFSSSLKMKMNPFLATNNAICTMEFLVESEGLRHDLGQVEWDLMIVDEAHHLLCEEGFVSKEYQIMYDLVFKTKGLLLLTGTPVQLDPASHFNRLRMLDPVRFYDYQKYLGEQDRYQKIARDLAKLPADSKEKLDWEDIVEILPKNSPIRSWLADVNTASLDANEWIRRIVDSTGTGSVVFRNTRKGVGGFPKRILKKVPLDPNPAYQKVLTAIAKEFERQEQFENSMNCYLYGLLMFPKTVSERASWGMDERVVWLKQFVAENLDEKVLLFTENETGAQILKHELAEVLEPSQIACFFDSMSIEDRDRASAKFARKDGAMILLSTDSGAEGRNFQFAHRLVLWDLPLDPVVLEQRIGRLDRIGQKSDVEIYVPYVRGSSQESLFRWYDECLCTFEHPFLNAGEVFMQHIDTLMLWLSKTSEYTEDVIAGFFEKVKKQCNDLRKKAEKGRDRLLEFNSRDPESAEAVIRQIKEFDEDDSISDFVLDVLKKQGVEAEPGALPDTLLLVQGGQVVDGAVLGMPSQGNSSMIAEESATEKSSLTVTLSRERAMIHEGIDFLSLEHPLAQGAIDFATAASFGTVACVLWKNSGRAGQMFMEYDFIVDFPVSTEWGLESIAGPSSARFLLNGSGEDFSELLEELEYAKLADLNVPQKNAVIEAKLRYFGGECLAVAKRLATDFANGLTEQVLEKLDARLDAEYDRMRHLVSMRGDAEGNSELAKLKKNNMERRKAVAQPAVRLDAIRLVVCR